MKRTASKHFYVIGFFLTILFGFGLNTHAAISISATVDKTHLTLEDTLSLTVKINGVQDSPEPVLPPLPDFQIQPQGRSSSIQVINGDMKSSLSFRYLLIPQKKGTFEIGPVRLERKGKHYESPLITVHIEEASAALPDNEKRVFAEALVSRSTAYLQEQIRLTYRFYRKVEVTNLSLDAPLEHFRKVPLGEPTQTSKVINGVRYYISEINYALYPMQAGILKVPNATFQLDVVKRNGGRHRSFGPGHLPGSIFDDPFFSGGATLERKVLRTREIEIKVLPFPDKNKPSPFHNLVGPVSLDSEINKDTLQAGETATWTLTVKGRGNMGEVALEIPADSDRFKIYKDQPALDERSVNGFIEGTKTFTYAIVPTTEGSLNLPNVKVDFWDPEKKMYDSISAKMLRLSVTPGQDSQPTDSTSSLARPSQQLPSGGPGLLPIHTRAELFDEPGSFTNTTAFKLAALLLPMVGFLVFRSIYGKSLRMQRDGVFARKQQAYSKAVNRLKEIESRTGEDGSLNARDVSAAFREYLGDRFEFQGTALTPEEVESRLKKMTLDESHISDALDLLGKCQLLEFTPAGPQTNDNLVVESLNLINTLEKTKA